MNTGSSYHDLFASNFTASAYKQYRPTYPSTVYTRIIDYLKLELEPPYTQALDVGCGSGQNTFGLAPFFDHVLGIDVSPAQVQKAQQALDKPLNVTFLVGNAHELPLADSSVQLVTSALAAHWFDPIQNFYEEVKRVLVPGGCLAIYGYNLPVLHYKDKSDQLNRLFWEYFKGPEMKEFQSEKSQEVNSAYKNFQLPFSDTLRIDDCEIRCEMTVDDFMGYTSSWSFYHAYRKAHPQEPDPLQAYRERTYAVVGTENPGETTITVTYAVFMLLGKKKISSRNHSEGDLK